MAAVNYDKTSAMLLDAATGLEKHATQTGGGNVSREDLIRIVGRLEGIAATLAGMKDAPKGVARE